MRTHDHADEQIAGRAAVHAAVALAVQRDGLAVVDTGGDGHADLVLTADAAHTAAGLAGLVDDLARAAAFRTRRGGLRHAEGRALGGTYGAAALAVGADLGRRAGGAAGALAVGALLHAADRDLFLAAEGRLLKGYVHAGAQIVAAARRVGIAARGAEAAAEKAREDVAQVAEIAEALKSAAAEAGGGIKGGVAELVVLRALVVVREDLVGLVDLLEPLLTGLVAGVQVRVILLCELSVCFFDLFGARALLQAEYLVIIAFFCHFILASCGHKTAL